MLIKDLPIEIQKRALECQVEQCNVESLKVDLEDNKYFGNFNWDETREGHSFWERVYQNSFSDFYEMYPKVDLQKEEEDLYNFLKS